MPRPSLKEQRTEEILDAFERCIHRVGLSGSSLEVIAEEAGMKRSILRHYIGNRDDILEALAARTISRYQSETDELMDYLRKGTGWAGETFVPGCRGHKCAESGGAGGADHGLGQE